MRRIALLAALFIQVAFAAAPQTGIWWSRSEGGRGYAIDVQSSTLVLLIYGYGTDGRMQWYYADGPLLNAGARWSGTLYKFDFGQPLNGPYTPAVNVGTEGVATIDFLSRTTGTLTVPGGRRVNIERYNFGVGTAPQSLLGDWVYVYSIGSSTFANRYRYSVIIGATENGTGIAANAEGTAAAEYQYRGELAGMVVAGEFTSTGTILNSFLFTQYLEEGRGSWVSMTTGSMYGMNAYRIVSPSGMIKTEPGMPGMMEGLPQVVGQFPCTLDEFEARNPAMGQAMRRLWERAAAHPR